MSENKRSSDFIRIVTPDGINEMASPQYIRKLIGCEGDKDWIINAIGKLQIRVYELERPQKTEALLKVIRESGPLNVNALKHRTDLDYHILQSLIDEGKVEEIRQKGQGKPRIYKAKEVE